MIMSLVCMNSCIDHTHNGFEILPIEKDLQEEMISKNVYGNNSPIAIQRLRLLQIKYVDFEGKERNGELMVLDACAKQVLQIFIELYEQKFPLAKVSLITHFYGDDSLSMVNNNTSCHNLRPVAGGKIHSLHAYGTAIDINPINNPFIDISCEDSLGISRIAPIAGTKYLNRMENRLGKSNRKGMAEEVVGIFAKNGFYWWGGYWDCPIDYQHFQISRSISELLAIMEHEEATIFFSKVQSYFNKTGQPIEYKIDEIKVDESSIREIYERSPDDFNKIIDQVFY